MLKIIKAYWLLVTERDGHWHPYGVGQMRRWLNGAWQVRQMTEKESVDEWNATQW
jgi:hypothetical protein